MASKLTPEQHLSLTNDIIAFLGESPKNEVFLGPEQLQVFVRLCVETDIDGGLYHHLFVNPPLKALFQFLREVIEEQKEAKRYMDLGRVVRSWGHAHYPMYAAALGGDDEPDPSSTVH